MGVSERLLAAEPGTRTGFTGWLCRHDAEYTALRKALRATATACVGFFVCRYGFGDVVMATYALFSAIAIGALSDVFGPPAVRTRVYLGALRALDAWGWLHALAHDLGRVERAVQPLLPVDAAHPSGLGLRCSPFTSLSEDD